MTRYLLVLATFLGAVAHANGISGIDCATKWKAADGYKDIDPLDTPFTCKGDVTAAPEAAKHVEMVACGSPAPGYICPTVTLRPSSTKYVFKSATGWRLTYNAEQQRWTLTGLPQRVPKGGPLDNATLLRGGVVSTSYNLVGSKGSANNPPSSSNLVGGTGGARSGPPSAGPGGPITICAGHLDKHGNVVSADPACGVTQFHRGDVHGSGQVYDPKNDCWHSLGHGCFNVRSGSGGSGAASTNAVGTGGVVTLRGGTPGADYDPGSEGGNAVMDPDAFARELERNGITASGGALAPVYDATNLHAGKVVVEGAHLLRPPAGIRWFTGGVERVFLDGDGTLHYRGSEVATRADIEREHLINSFSVILGTAGAALMLIMVGVWVAYFVSRARAKAYYDEQEKRTGVDGGPFRS